MAMSRGTIIAVAVADRSIEPLPRTLPKNNGNEPFGEPSVWRTRTLTASGCMSVGVKVKRPRASL